MYLGHHELESVIIIIITCLLHDYTWPQCVISNQAKCIPKLEEGPPAPWGAVTTILRVDYHGLRVKRHRSGQQSQQSHTIELAKTHLCSVQLQPSDITLDLVAGALHAARQSSVQEHQQPNQLHMLKQCAPTR